MGSYSYAPYVGVYDLLTTLFIPPSQGCYDRPPTLWEYCWTATATPTPTLSSTSSSRPNPSSATTTTTFTSCYWPLPASCYPDARTKAQTYTADLPGEPYPVAYGYSPGVVPPSFQTLGAIQNDAGGAFSVGGCYSGWSNDSLSFCTSPATASYVVGSSTQHGPITALLPQIIATWAQSDLQWFTPRSAPLLPPASITSALEAAARSSASYSAAFSYAASHSPALTTADKAGIGVGVGVGVLIILGAVFFLFRLRRKRRRARVSGKVAEEKGAPELASAKHENGTSASEAAGSGINQLPTNQRIQQLGDPDPNQLPDHPIQQLDADNEIHELPSSGLHEDKGDVRAVTPSLRR